MSIAMRFAVFCFATSSRKRRSAAVRLAMPCSLILSSTRSTSAATGSRIGATARAERRRRACAAPAPAAPDCTITTRSTARGGGCGLRRESAWSRKKRKPKPRAADVRDVGHPVVRRELGQRRCRGRTHDQDEGPRLDRAWGAGNTISSASGQSMANATATPSTAPEAPDHGRGRRGHEAGEDQATRPPRRCRSTGSRE